MEIAQETSGEQGDRLAVETDRQALSFAKSAADGTSPASRRERCKCPSLICFFLFLFANPAFCSSKTGCSRVDYERNSPWIGR